MVKTNYLKQRIFIFFPYLAVFLGLYFFKNAFVSILIYHIGIICSLLFIKSDYRIKDLLKFENKLLLFVTTIICALSGLVLLYLWDYIELPNLNLFSEMNSIGLSGRYKILFLIYFSTIHPILEESYWRFFLKNEYKLFVLDDILFSLYHSFVLILFVKLWFVIVCFIALVLVSAIWRKIRQKKEENLIILVSHAVADFSIMLAILSLY